MAINIEAQYPGKTGGLTAEYPQGAPRNITVSGDGTGTPWDAALVKDMVGPLQAILLEAGVTPSGVPDTALVSQYLEGLRAILNARSVTHNIAVDADYTLTAAQNKFTRVIITDTVPTLTLPRNIIVDNTFQRRFLAVNNTLQILTFKTSAGTGIAVTVGQSVELLCDGTNVIAVTSQSVQPFLHIQDQKASGVDGGTSVVGSNPRTLNTVLTNSIAGASLATNQITLPAGTYYIEAYSSAYGALGQKTRLHNVTDVTIPLVGYPSGLVAGNGETISELAGTLTIAATKVFSLSTYQSQAIATIGLGNHVTDGSIEIYTDIKIWKVA